MIVKIDGAVLSSAGSAISSFTADVPGDYVVTLSVADHLGWGDPVSITVTAVSAEDLAQIVIVETSTTLAELDASAVTTGGNQNAMSNFLTQAAIAIEEGDIEAAIDKLNQGIERTDGCVLRGEPDGNGAGRDWVTDCAAQEELYLLLNAALDAITP